jgi:hypothetical protein
MFMLSVDLGHLADDTAIAILACAMQPEPLPSRKMERIYHLRHLERPALRTP